MGPNPEKKAGYEKVENTCTRAKDDGFDYVWIDTCCIDKTSSAELSEAINSMYRWYQDSLLCYVYLADVSPSTINGQTRVISPEFGESRWFTRGWTLQELIAPSFIIFLDQRWQEIGTESSLHLEISKITQISTNILLEGDMNKASIAQRMSWASRRSTTRDEDIAYCLMGVFGINMPLLYGEGTRAFIRLQEEIIKISDDYSLFAWTLNQEKGSGLLAPSPAAFFGSGNIVPSDHLTSSSGAITVDNKGIHLNLPFRFIDEDRGIAILPCSINEKIVAIYLRSISSTNKPFRRIYGSIIQLLEPRDFNEIGYCEKSICVEQSRRIRENSPALLKAAEMGHEGVMNLLLQSGAEIETSNSDGITPLLQVAYSGHKALVELLLERGASIEASDNYRRTPLIGASQNGHEAVVKLLLERGASVWTSDNDGMTPLLWAAQKGHEAVVKLLLEKGADIEACESDRMTPLLWAAQNGHEAVVKLLLERGANVEYSGYTGTPLLEGWKITEGCTEIVGRAWDSLLSYGQKSFHFMRRTGLCCYYLHMQEEKRGSRIPDSCLSDSFNLGRSV